MNERIAAAAIARAPAKDPNDQNNTRWRMNLAIGYTAAGIQSADNGNVVTVSDNLGNASQDYTMGYDPLNRLSSWSTGGGTNCQFAIDQYGNLGLASGSGCAMLSGLSFNGNNQIVGYSYDASGNLLTDNAGSNYTWDGNSQLVSFYAQGASGSYVYDGLLRRVEKMADGVTTLYARDAAGNVVASLTGGVWTDYIWDDPVGVGNSSGAQPAAAGAERIAAVMGSGDGTVYYFHKDQVGTTRVITDGNGNNVANCGQNATYPNGSFLTYGPFGGELDCTQQASAYKFAGHEKDAASGLAHFRYRQLSTTVGRWLTPDPAGNKSACPKNPQTQNRYAYVTNGPANGSDYDGLYRLAYWNNPLVCSPPGELYLLDGMEEPPCPWEEVAILLPVPQFFVDTCSCRRLNSRPEPLGECAFDCSCRPPVEAFVTAVPFPTLEKVCPPLRGKCPAYISGRWLFRIVFGNLAISRKLLQVASCRP